MLHTVPAGSPRPQCLSTASVLVAAILFSAAASAQPAPRDVEVRQFSMFVDGQRAGEHVMTIEQLVDGTVKVTGHADIRVKTLLATYAYSYRGSEEWKNGRLVRLDSDSNDNGKRSAISAVRDKENLHVRVNATDGVTHCGEWTTTYWCLPDARSPDRPLPILDIDTGREVHAVLRCVGTKQVKVAEQVLACARYRLTGEVKAELWYDKRNRLVREESLEDGHQIVLELSRIGVHPGSSP